MSTQLAWAHINVNVSDLDRSVAFYEKLGFRQFLSAIPYLNLQRSAVQALPQTCQAALALPEGASGRACIMELDDGFPKLDLTEFKGLTQGKPLENADLGIVRLCLRSEDLSSDYARLTADGVEFLSEPVTCHDRLAEVAVCSDPDGTLIEILQVHLERWAPYLS